MTSYDERWMKTLTSASVLFLYWVDICKGCGILRSIVVKMEETYLVYGQLISGQNLEELAQLFVKMKAKLGESSHYEGGKYLRITDAFEAELTFEKVERKEFLIKGDADTKENLQNLCKRVSDVLTANQLKHRMELYDEADVQFYYLHFNWENK